MSRILTIALLTFKAVMRYRLVLVLGVLLLGAVVALPLLIKDDGTARGFTQILMTYTLTAITTLLGFASLWLACGTLAGEIEECQIQMVVVKPVGRWQIWLGKWLGIMMLNTLLLGLSGIAVFGLTQWRAQKLPAEQQQVLRNEILVARGSFKETLPNLEPVIENAYQQRLRQTPVAVGERRMLLNQISELVKSDYQLVRPGYARRWIIDLGLKRNSLRDKPLTLRIRFATAQSESTVEDPRTYPTLWQVGVPDTSKTMRAQMNFASDSYHEFQIPANLFDDKGILTIDCVNPNDIALLFQLDNGLEVLYHEGGFGLNFFRGVGVIYCWLAMLSALGLAASSFLSFPVAAFLSLGVLMIGFSTGTLSQIIEERGITGINNNTGRIDIPNLVDDAMVTIASGLLGAINLARDFSPIDSLSSGRSITWWQLLRAAGQIVIFMGGLFSAIGIFLFNRRELATAQGSQG